MRTNSKYLASLILIFFGCMAMSVAAAGSANIADDRYHRVIEALKTENSRGIINCARSLFICTEVAYEYDLEASVRSMKDLQKLTDGAGNPFGAGQAISLLLGVPLRQDGSVKSYIMEAAFREVDTGREERAKRTQLIAKYSHDDHANKITTWPSELGMQPLSMSIWKDGITYTYWRAGTNAAWLSRENHGGVFLVPPFEMYGSVEKYIGRAYYGGSWKISIAESNNNYICTWRRTILGAQQFVSLELSTQNIGIVYRAWRGYGEQATHESIYSDHIQLSENVFYPRKILFRVMVPIGDHTLPIRDESYELVGTNISLSCDIPPDIFDYRSYQNEKVSEGPSKAHRGSALHGVLPK